MSYTNSSLVDYIKISPNKNSPRNHNIDTITIHCVVGQVTVERLGDIFANPNREASSNYGIGYDGRIGLYVDECDRSWCSSSPSNDHRAITIEVASDTTHPYAVTDAAYNTLIELVTDICRRNNIKKLLWKADKSLIGKIDQQNMTVHRWFANKACPGEYLYSRHYDIAEKVNAKLEGRPTPMEKTPVNITYQVCANKRWLPNVVNKEDYAGIFGQSISAVYVNADVGNVYYKVHRTGSNWLPEVKNREDYAGIFNQSIDAFMIKSDSTTIHYQAHLKDGKWLPEVTGYNENDNDNGYAGILGKDIDGIYIWADPIIKYIEEPIIEEPPVEEPKPEEPIIEEPKQEDPVVETPAKEPKEDNTTTEEPKQDDEPIIFDDEPVIVIETPNQDNTDNQPKEDNKEDSNQEEEEESAFIKFLRSLFDWIISLFKQKGNKE